MSFVLLIFLFIIGFLVLESHSAQTTDAVVRSAVGSAFFVALVISVDAVSTEQRTSELQGVHDALLLSVANTTCEDYVESALQQAILAHNKNVMCVIAIRKNHGVIMRLLIHGFTPFGGEEEARKALVPGEKLCTPGKAVGCGPMG